MPKCPSVNNYQVCTGNLYFRALEEVEPRHLGNLAKLTYETRHGYRAFHFYLEEINADNLLLLERCPLRGAFEFRANNEIGPVIDFRSDVTLTVGEFVVDAGCWSLIRLDAELDYDAPVPWTVRKNG
jgi:hypothetical protein